MTVAELIDELRKYPQGAVVVAYGAGEDWSELDPCDIDLEEKKYYTANSPNRPITGTVVTIIG